MFQVESTVPVSVGSRRSRRSGSMTMHRDIFLIGGGGRGGIAPLEI